MQEKMNSLREVKYDPEIRAKIELQKLKMQEVIESGNADVSSQNQYKATLIKFRIKKNTDSKILSDYQLSNLAEHMLPMYRR